jgi:U4/U6.U5 tri-snRNP-associated protein 2
LDTINRGTLDFDFEKCCSVSLTHTNVYVCLVCGKYFQGRGTKTYAYTHSLEMSHHIFMHLKDGSAWCLPDGYKIEDRSLDDIRAFLNPTFRKQELQSLDKSIRWSRAIDGTEYMPGLVGLNNMKANDYANVVIQIFARVRPLRDFFLSKENYTNNPSIIVQRTGELLRKIWYPKHFKGQVSPHEFMQAVKMISEKQFLIEKKGEVLSFFSWFLNTLHRELRARNEQSQQSIITQTFQGRLLVSIEHDSREDPKDTLLYEKMNQIPFYSLGLNLPQTAVFKDTFNRIDVPQVPLSQLLKKYNAREETIHENRSFENERQKRFKVVQMPSVLVLNIHRFRKNSFFWEKNSSIVNFPMKNFDTKDISPLSTQKTTTLYDLIATVSHEGSFEDGIYKAYIHRKIEDIWYEVQDLNVKEVLPQIVALSEAYLLIYERLSIIKK